jgi:hypothetical protein
MTVDNTITKFPHPASQEKTITLDEAIQSMTEWRINKGTRGEQIPDDIWKNIFTLLKKYPEATVCAALGLTKMQLHRKLDEKKSPIATVSSQLPKTPHIDFCEVNQTQTPLYKPARIPATNTLVVEFCRADGRIMKIHTTTDSFSELMKAFFAGE